jgi:hypothetical protein
VAAYGDQYFAFSFAVRLWAQAEDQGEVLQYCHRLRYSWVAGTTLLAESLLLRMKKTA